MRHDERQCRRGPADPALVEIRRAMRPPEPRSVGAQPHETRTSPPPPPCGKLESMASGSRETFSGPSAASVRRNGRRHGKVGRRVDVVTLAAHRPACPRFNFAPGPVCRPQCVPPLSRRRAGQVGEIDRQNVSAADHAEPISFTGRAPPLAMASRGAAQSLRNRPDSCF